MSVDPTRGRSQGFALVAAAAGVLALGACDDPTQNTDLRPDGDPEVLAVLVMNDAANKLVETATYCAPNDPKRPNIVGLPDFTAPSVCPDDLAKGADEVTDAYPDGWYVRIMFDELLNPDIEELTEILDPDTGEGTDTYTGSIANTHPVNLQCESVGGGFVDVPYDGYYSPAGNAVTWPLGPSLVIKPLDSRTVATNSECKVTINENVVDKSGNKVPSTQRGEYKFKVAPVSVVAIDPPDDPDGTGAIDATQIYFDNVYVQFNTAIGNVGFSGAGPTSLCTPVNPANPFFGCDPSQPISFKFSDENGYCSSTGDVCSVAMAGADCPTVGDTCDRGVYAYSLVPFGFTDTEFGIGPFEPIKSDTEYTFEIPQGATVTDRCGKVSTFGAPSAANNTLIHFKTKKFAFKAANIGTGDLATPTKKLQLNFTNVVDPASLATSEYTLTPTPANAGTPVIKSASDGSGNLQLVGDLALDTTYTFTLKAGATFEDYYGVVYTNETEKVITWKTQPAITLTSSTADKSTLLKTLPTSTVRLTFGFNQHMDPTTLDPTDYTVTDSTGAEVTGFATAISAGCTAAATSCTLSLGKASVPVGTYKFTLKKDAQLKDVLGNTYTQAADKVINFTVKDRVVPTLTCL